MNSVAFSILGFDIGWYSLCIMLGVIIGYSLYIFECKKYNINMDFCTNLIFWTIIFGIIGARIYYVCFNLDYYLSDPISIFKVWEGGLAIHGGILAGLIFVIIYTKKYKVKTLKLTDILCVGLIIAQACGRWGNFFNQEAHGPETTLKALEGMKIIPKFVINGMNINEIYYVPTFYYESLWCLLGFIILLIIRRVVKYLKVGQLTGIYLIWYSIGRFFIESLRTDSLMLGSIKVAQLISVILFIAGIILIIKNIGKSKFENKYDEMEADDVRF